jgi:predicted RNA binding protein YcfA (HicA-like mRNA interferase family)
MPRKGCQLKAGLRKSGFLPVRQKGSHVTWEHEGYPDIAVVLAIQEGEDADPYEERAVRHAIIVAGARNKEEEPWTGTIPT